MPGTVYCNGARYEHIQTFKHDFFAATGLYRGADGLAVLKLGRVADLFSLPMAWIGKLLTRQEIRIFQQAADVPGVPRLLGRVGSNGLLRSFIPGHPLGRRETVSDTFFAELFALVQTLHARHVALVDLNKRQNILLGEDGRPYLIDFQISLHLPPRGWWRLRPVRWLLARFQQADIYHCLKHKRRLRPDLLTPDDRHRVERLSVWIRLHRWLTRPVTRLRRRTLKRLEKTEHVNVVGSSAD